MLLKEVIAELEALSPPDFAEKWDNSGLMCGREKKEINKILLAVDATDEVVEEAILSEADLLLTHHPLIFPTISSVTEKDIVGRRLLKLIQADICCYAMHTNFDVIGMADEAADKLNLLDRKVLDVLPRDIDAVFLPINGVGNNMNKADAARFAEIADRYRLYR